MFSTFPYLLLTAISFLVLEAFTEVLMGSCISNNTLIGEVISMICGNKMPTKCNRWFLLQILLLAQQVSGTTLPITRSSRVLYRWMLPVVFMMGIVVPETCWASNKICNKKHLLHLVGILFPHINDDAQSKSHQIFMESKVCGACTKYGVDVKWNLLNNSRKLLFKKK